MVDYKGKTVLITGGTGFVGGRIAERLILEEDANVRVLVRNWTKAVWVSRLAAELMPGDVLDRDSVFKAVRGCDLVFHCANGFSDEGGGYVRTNVEGTRNILDACNKYGIERVVYLSSIAVHGSSLPSGADEMAPHKLQGRDYSDSKIMTEQLLLDYYQNSRVPVTILRPTFIWGPRSHLFTIRQIREMKTGAFVYTDKGTGSCNAVYIDNLVDAMLLAGIRDEAVGKAFLITDGLEITWADLFKHYADLLGIRHLPSINSRSFFSRFACRQVDVLRGLLERLKGNPAPLWRKVVRRSARELLTVLEKRYCSYWDLEKYAWKGKIDISRAQELLGYNPRYGIKNGMKDTLEWVSDQMGAELGLTKLI